LVGKYQHFGATSCFRGQAVVTLKMQSIENPTVGFYVSCNNCCGYWCQKDDKPILIQYLQLQKENGFIFGSSNPFCKSPSTNFIDSSWKLGSVRRALVTSGTLLTVAETKAAPLSKKNI